MVGFFEKSRYCKYTVDYGIKHTIFYWEHFRKYFTNFCVTDQRHLFHSLYTDSLLLLHWY